MIYPIYIYGSPVLRAKASDIDENYPGLEQLAADMFDTLYASEGVGLAAPQIGKSIRMFVVDASPFGRDDPAAAGFKHAFVNPVIYESSDETVAMNEGCLSIPGIHEDVDRPESIRIRWYDEHFVLHDALLTGWPARIVQHEYDHVEGKVFTDRLSPLRKTLVRNKLAAMGKGKYKADYRTKLVR